MSDLESEFARKEPHHLVWKQRFVRMANNVGRASLELAANPLVLSLLLALTTAGCTLASRKFGDRDAAAAGVEQVLFNGTDFAGWKLHCKAQDRSKVYWRVEAGCIVADSMADAKHDYIWLATEREFGDFELRLKFQAFRDSPGNSGIQIRSRYDEAAGWLDGPQLDIHPPAPWRTGMIYDETRGVQKWISPNVPKVSDVRPEMSAANLVFHYFDQTPAWNEYEITLQGTRVRAVLNGVVVQDWDGAGVLDDATHRERNVGMRGHIALQIHKGDQLRMRFRDISIRELDGAQ